VGMMTDRSAGLFSGPPQSRLPSTSAAGREAACPISGYGRANACMLAERLLQLHLHLKLLLGVCGRRSILHDHATYRRGFFTRAGLAVSPISVLRR